MGFVWDLIQHNQISKTREHAASLESRVANLEDELYRTQDLLRTLIIRLEQRFGEDIDSDGRVGR